MNTPQAIVRNDLAASALASVRSAPAPVTAGVGMPLLIALAALGAAAMNLLLPSLPYLEAVFDVDYHATQSLLTYFLAGAALAQLGVGPLADAYDRRTILLLALVTFIAGSVVAALAPTILTLGLGRFLQGFGGAACLVLAEAIVSRASAPSELARRIGFLNAGMAIAIMTAPLAGAAIGTILGWRAIFWVSLAAAGLLLFACARGLPRTAKLTAGEAPARLFGGMGELLRSRRFVGSTLAAGFVMANYFCLAAFGPYIAMNILGLGRVKYGLLFAALGIGYIAGSIVSGRLYDRFGEKRVVVATLVLGIAAGVAGFVLADLGALGKDAFLAVGCIVALTTGLTLPAATGRALGAATGAAGTAAGFFNFAIFGIGGLVTHVVGDNMDAAATMAMGALPVVTLIALGAILLSYGRNAGS